MSASQCPACGAPRGAGAECPSCGAIYAKAAARVSRPAAPAGAVVHGRGAAVLDEIRLNRKLEEARLELQERTWAVPIAFAVCWLLVKTEMGHFVLRTWLSMWVHELGHAVTAWFCGFFAFPGPWATQLGESRSLLMTLLLGGALGYLGWWGHSQGNRWLIAVAASLLPLQLLLTFGLSHKSAQALISFGGDAGCLVLGSVLVSTVYLDPEHHLRRQWLHWGFLVIGAAAVTDVFEEWWSARRDVSRIPFGEFERSGALSDPSALVQQHGWTISQLVGRYVGLGVLCLLALAALWVWHLREARARLEAAESASRRPVG